MEQEIILIRLTKKNEFLTYPKKKWKILDSFQEKTGYQVVYKPYGSNGDKSGEGFYYVKNNIK
jgi:hypothetical protein